jgi:peptide/nickel transport system substrate-binding protein
MQGRFWLSIASAAIGASLLTAAGFARPAVSKATTAVGSGESRGGTLRIDLRSDWGSVDPGLAYTTTAWQMLNATQLKLVSFPDADGAAGSRIVPEAASGLPRVSRDGRTYTFTIRRGLRFSDGRAVTAKNFSHAFRRALSPKMESPASAFLADVAGYRAQGQTLTIRLKQVAPDFLARLTMPFFSAVPLGLPLDPEGVQAPLVSAGPYVLKEWIPRRSALVVRNPYWKAGRQPWKAIGRPANVDRMVFTFGNSLDATKLRLERNEVDLGSIPPAAASELAPKYGINKGRFFIRRTMMTWYLALNNERPLFRGNVRLRKAVNIAIDRPHLVRQFGFLGGGRTDQILPPGMPGYGDAQLYPMQGADVARGRSLARGVTRGGKATLYTFGSAPGPALAQVVQYNLGKMGIDTEIRTFDRQVQHEKIATRGEAFDIALDAWVADYPDPANFMNVLLDGTRIQDANNTNVAYFNDAATNRKLAQAARLFGPERLAAYRALDASVMKDRAPVAPFANAMNKVFVSSSLGCFVHSPIYGNVNLAAVCKK